MFENTTPVPSQNEATRWKLGFNVSQLISIDGRLFSNARIRFGALHGGLANTATTLGLHLSIQICAVTDIWDSILLSQELGQLINKDGRLLSNTRIPVAMNGW